MINYPNKKTSYSTGNNKNTANRGMALEEMINISNERYLNTDRAFITKRPTPIKVLKSEDVYHVTDGYFLSPSTLDYVGVYKGKYLDFDAKETINKKGFPSKNIAIHQIEAIKNIIKFGGIAFLIIHLKHFNEIYLVDGNDVIEMYNTYKSTMPYEIIKEKGILIKEALFTPVDYLKAVDDKYLK